jgi:hypothetical protein
LEVEEPNEYNGMKGLSVFAASVGRSGGGHDLFTGGMAWLQSSKPFATRLIGRRG